MTRASLLVAALAALPTLCAHAAVEPPLVGGAQVTLISELVTAAPVPPLTSQTRLLSETFTGQPAAALVSFAQPPAEEPAATPEQPSAPLLSEQAVQNGGCQTECGCKPTWHHLCVVDECCAPDICRFDCPADCTCCTTQCYCDNPCSHCYHGTSRQTGECGGWVTDACYCDVQGRPDWFNDSAVRIGGWAIESDGSPQRVAEYESLDSSAFFDVDGIRSDGERTLNFSLSGFDNEANDARVKYYGPNVTAKFDYERYLHRLDHDPLYGAPRSGPLGPNDNVVTEDLNLGEDYAIRVEQLNAKFSGKLTDNVKWKLDLWGQRKFGERQSNATAHCFNVNAPAPAGANGNVCHVLSQKQTIDWLTMEIRPAVEAKFDYGSIEYSRTMREFDQGDGVITRQYTRFNFQLPAASGFLGPPYDYAITPENFTQVDRIKANLLLDDYNDLYAHVYHGDTENFERDMHRNYSGYDVRLTNRAFERTTLTAYTSWYDENNELPGVFYNAPPLSPANNYDRTSLRHDIDRTITRAGVKGVWKPYGDDRVGGPIIDPWTTLAINGGYDFSYLARDYVTYSTALGPFTQPDTITHQVWLGPSIRWSPSLENFLRYKVRFSNVPLIGIREANGRFNTNQPEQEHRVELGGTWQPQDNFMATVEFDIVNTWNDSQYADFTENNYPINCTLWYAPTERLSLSGGYAYFSNWIDQDITLGYRFNVADQTETTRWSYGGQAHVLSLNAHYAWTPTVQLVGGYEWTHGSNVFSVPPSPAAADWSLLPSLSDVIVEIQRFTAGVDWQRSANVNLYCRYIFNDYNDISASYESGTAHMVLAGATVVW